MNDLICYCFGYTVADIELDLRRNGGSTILLRVCLPEATFSRRSVSP